MYNKRLQNILMSKTTVYLIPHTERSVKGCFKMLQHKGQVHAMNNMIKEHHTLWQEPLTSCETRMALKKNKLLYMLVACVNKQLKANKKC